MPVFEHLLLSSVIDKSGRRIGSAPDAGTKFAQHAVTDGQVPFLFGIGLERRAALFAVTRFGGGSELGVERGFRVGRMVPGRQLQEAVFKNGFRRGVEASTFERRVGRLGVVLTAERVDRDDRVWSREVLMGFLATVVSHVRISS